METFRKNLSVYNCQPYAEETYQSMNQLINQSIKQKQYKTRNEKKIPKFDQKNL